MTVYEGVAEDGTRVRVAVYPDRAELFTLAPGDNTKWRGALILMAESED